MTRSLFDLVVPIEATSREFRHIREYAGFTAARRLMDEVFAGFQDVDHSFVREFQTGGFSPRVFELALFAYLKEQGYDLDRSSPAPDLVIRGDVAVAIEVTTSNPSQDADEDDAALSTSARIGVPTTCRRVSGSSCSRPARRYGASSLNETQPGWPIGSDRTSLGYPSSSPWSLSMPPAPCSTRSGGSRSTCMADGTSSPTTPAGVCS
jgi:hypothetical protein